MATAPPQVQNRSSRTSFATSTSSPVASPHSPGLAEAGSAVNERLQRENDDLRRAVLELRKDVEVERLKAKDAHREKVAKVKQALDVLQEEKMRDLMQMEEKYKARSRQPAVVKHLDDGVRDEVRKLQEQLRRLTEELAQVRLASKDADMRNKRLEELVSEQKRARIEAERDRERARAECDQYCTENITLRKLRADADIAFQASELSCRHALEQNKFLQQKHDAELQDLRESFRKERARDARQLKELDWKIKAQDKELSELGRLSESGTGSIRVPSAKRQPVDTSSDYPLMQLKLENERLRRELIATQSLTGDPQSVEEKLRAQLHDLQSRHQALVKQQMLSEQGFANVYSLLDSVRAESRRKDAKIVQLEVAAMAHNNINSDDEDGMEDVDMGVVFAPARANVKHLPSKAGITLDSTSPQLVLENTSRFDDPVEKSTGTTSAIEHPPGSPREVIHDQPTANQPAELETAIALETPALAQGVQLVRQSQFAEPDVQTPEVAAALAMPPTVLSEQVPHETKSPVEKVFSDETVEAPLTSELSSPDVGMKAPVLTQETVGAPSTITTELHSVKRSPSLSRTSSDGDLSASLEPASQAPVADTSSFSSTAVVGVVAPESATTTAPIDFVATTRERELQSEAETDAPPLNETHAGMSVIADPKATLADSNPTALNISSRRFDVDALYNNAIANLSEEEPFEAAKDQKDHGNSTSKQAPPLNGLVDELDQSNTRLVKALYSYDPISQSPNPDPEFELPLDAGETIRIFGGVNNDGFFIGEARGKRGLVPSNFVEDIVESTIAATAVSTSPEVNSTPSEKHSSITATPTIAVSEKPRVLRVMIALYDYDPATQSPNEEPDLELAFKTNERVEILSEMHNDGFYDGRIGEREGLVPSNFLGELPEVEAADARPTSRLSNDTSEAISEDDEDSPRPEGKRRRSLLNKTKNFLGRFKRKKSKSELSSEDVQQ